MGLDKEGISQHTEYVAFGEVLFDEHKVSRRMPYLFNGKELDSETGLYYYGARYYDAKVSLWLGTDPLSGYNPIMETEHYIDGQHNGGVYNSGNLNSYIYCYQNPIIFVDPNGKQNYSFILKGKQYNYSVKEVNVYSHTIVSNGDGYVRYRNSQNDQVVNRIQSNYKPLNNWTGSSEDRITIFLKGQNKPFTVSSQDVAPQYRATFVNDVSRLFGAYNGDKVRAFEAFSDFMDPVNKGISYLSAFNSFAAVLDLPLTGTDILNQFLIDQEKGKFSKSTGKATGAILNNYLSGLVKRKYGASGQAAYNVAVAPLVEKSLTKVAEEYEKSNNKK
ncbi:RHS repeat-associated core domain-containing protein [Bergeyella sp. RCAD1439]|uniref:RHS repeat-associated core domain-containing protein n=1 Tax=Bergeyella anatis TaxID=3113737 RepID=UPI002E173823|nr:RHS repeat-associated core domain-containing protein [Bergeyella sp. RCAD1439]